MFPGDLENFKNTPFTLKEGVDYRIKINFKVREPGLCQSHGSPLFWRRNVAVAVAVAKPHLMMHVSVCRSTRKSCPAWNTSRVYSGKAFEVRQRFLSHSHWRQSRFHKMIFSSCQLKCDESWLKVDSPLMMSLIAWHWKEHNSVNALATTSGKCVRSTSAMSDTVCGMASCTVVTNNLILWIEPPIINKH